MFGVMDRLARGFALLGGLVLSGLIVMTCLSVTGRTLNFLGLGPINGDFELVEAGMAFVIFAFLPLCQLRNAHASVDIFSARLPARVQLLLRGIIEVVFAAVLVMIAWQLADGMFSKLRSGQTTFLLQFPVWWAYAFSLSGAVVAAMIGVYVAALRLGEAVTGRVLLPVESGAEP